MAAIHLTVGERIRRARLAADMSPTELARRLGISRQYLWSLETGAKAPSLERLHSIATALGVSPSAFDDRLGE